MSYTMRVEAPAAPAALGTATLFNSVTMLNGQKQLRQLGLTMVSVRFHSLDQGVTLNAYGSSNGGTENGGNWDSETFAGTAPVAVPASPTEPYEFVVDFLDDFKLDAVAGAVGPAWRVTIVLTFNASAVQK